MDGIIDYLPSPTEKAPIVNVLDEDDKRKPISSEKLCAYVYKILNDPEKGCLAFARIYSGVLSIKSPNLLNVSNDNSERIREIFRVRADRYISKK